MAIYLASDVHLRLDRPDRARRFARWIDSLAPEDSLTIAGDLCDFWYAARQMQPDPMACAGLRALASYRARGGSLTILAGNHDLWLGPFYEQALGARFVPEPLDVDLYGVRVRVVHGHRLGARRLWKKAMESHDFLRAFERCPGPLARTLDGVLDRSNAKNRARDDERHLAVFRKYADGLGSRFDILALGHLHQPMDDAGSRPRLIILGGWHFQASYLRIDPSGASLVIEPAPVGVACESSS